MKTCETVAIDISWIIVIQEKIAWVLNQDRNFLTLMVQL